MTVLDIAVGNAVIFLTFKEAFPFISFGHKNLMYAPRPFVKFQIRNSAELLAVAQIDYHFTFKVRIEHFFHPVLFIICQFPEDGTFSQSFPCIISFGMSILSFIKTLPVSSGMRNVTGKGQTIMAQGKVEICGVNTAKLPLLNSTEKEVLFARISQGDHAAREQYIEGNLRLVLSVIKRFSQSNENVDDLFQIGCIGLIKAIDNFDSTLNVKFSTYAVPMIQGEIRRFLRDNNAIRVSRSLKDTAYKAIYAKEALTKQHLKEPTIEEISSEIGISAEDISYALDAIQTPMSLYEPIFTDGGDTLYVMDQISDKKNKEETWVEHLSLNDAIKKLNDREREIISLRFFSGKTQMEVAEMIGISQAQVSRLEKNALRTMRSYLTA